MKWIIEDGACDFGTQSVIALQIGSFRNAVAVQRKRWNWPTRIRARLKLKQWVQAIKPGRKYRLLKVMKRSSKAKSAVMQPKYRAQQQRDKKREQKKRGT